MDKLRVAIINPSLPGHESRGTGVYTRLLLEALNERRDIIAEVAHIRDAHVFDVVHYPYFDPFFLTLPLSIPKPTVVTVHDLIPFRFPDKFSPGLRGRIKWEIQRLSLRRKSAVITDSHASKDDIISYTHIAPDKIHVVYLGISEDFGDIDAGVTKHTRERYTLPESFILYVGDVNYNKNVEGLIDAFASPSLSERVHLVLVGKGFTVPTPQQEGIMHKIHHHTKSSNIHVLGSVRADELRALYHLAAVYVQPSFAEGFGFPVLEAMACGTPVVSSNTTSLKEITGDAALLVDPYDIEALSAGINSVVTDTTLRTRLITNGARQVTMYTWKKCASETTAVYQQVLENHA